MHPSWPPKHIPQNKAKHSGKCDCQPKHAVILVPRRWPLTIGMLLPWVSARALQLGQLGAGLVEAQAGRGFEALLWWDEYNRDPGRSLIIIISSGVLLNVHRLIIRHSLKNVFNNKLVMLPCLNDINKKRNFRVRNHHNKDLVHKYGVVKITSRPK